MKKSSQDGFTLIELLVVVAIIAVLASIALPAYTGVQERARATQDMNNLRQIGISTQSYMNDNDGTIFSSDPAKLWMTLLHPAYLPAWKIFQSPFDKRTASEVDASAPISYGINGNKQAADATPPNMAGVSIDKLANPSGFILFAPAQDSTKASPAFVGTPSAVVTVYRSASSPGGTAVGGTHSRRSRINVLFADAHTENYLWATFIKPVDATKDPGSESRWDSLK